MYDFLLRNTNKGVFKNVSYNESQRGFKQHWTPLTFTVYCPGGKLPVHLPFILPRFPSTLKHNTVKKSKWIIP